MWGGLINETALEETGGGSLPVMVSPGWGFIGLPYRHCAGTVRVCEAAARRGWCCAVLRDVGVYG